MKLLRISDKFAAKFRKNVEKSDEKPGEDCRGRGKLRKSEIIVAFF